MRGIKPVSCRNERLRSMLPPKLKAATSTAVTTSESGRALERVA
jgi:hypothetical protein